ncbi:hypothetical protein NE237_022343 [Protea cynaroides]|uniref:Uncharacterized protein n=1 Tax=Protea cynaroides TaxID=273540 RepID=A0A9Q0K3F3_9MAGN|nr:hypothetical protein NE237_022343 [Protea cynaroides]
MMLFNKVLLNMMLLYNKVLNRKHREAEEQDKMILLKKKLLVKEEDPLHREAEEQDKMILLKKKLLVKEEDPLHRSGLGALLNEPGWQIWFVSSSQRTRRRLGDSGPLLNANGMLALEQGGFLGDSVAPQCRGD